MRSTFTGKINAGLIFTAVSILSKKFKVVNLPVCVDFDHVFDPSNPTRCIVRSNVENPTENLFYVTKPSQSILNQVEAKLIPNGKYYSFLPCKSVEAENSNTFANNLSVFVFFVSQEDETDEMVATVRSLYDSLGVVYSQQVCENNKACVDFIINGICVCRVESFWLHDTYVTVAEVISEPRFSHAVSLII